MFKRCRKGKITALETKRGKWLWTASIGGEYAFGTIKRFDTKREALKHARYCIRKYDIEE